MDVFDLDSTLLGITKSSHDLTPKFGAEGYFGFQVDSLYQSRRFWPEPLMSINPNFELGANVQDLVRRKGTLHPLTAQVFRMNSRPITLYRHQAQAVAKASSGQSFFVTTGTVSGKSLCFFVPIIDAVLRARTAAEADNSERLWFIP